MWVGGGARRAGGAANGSRDSRIGSEWHSIPNSAMQYRSLVKVVGGPLSGTAGIVSNDERKKKLCFRIENWCEHKLQIPSTLPDRPMHACVWDPIYKAGSRPWDPVGSLADGRGSRSLQDRRDDQGSSSCK